MADFTHFNENGRAKMVDVSEKADTVRTAVAAGRVLVNAETFELIKTGKFSTRSLTIDAEIDVLPTPPLPATAMIFALFSNNTSPLQLRFDIPYAF